MLCGVNFDLRSINVDVNPDIEALCEIEKKMPGRCHFVLPTLHMLFDQFVNYVRSVYFNEFKINWLHHEVESLTAEIAEYNATWSQHYPLLRRVSSQWHHVAMGYAFIAGGGEE